MEEIDKDGVEHVVAMSQYPQYSCTTSGSSMKAIYKYYQVVISLLNGFGYHSNSLSGELPVASAWSQGN